MSVASGDFFNHVGCVYKIKIPPPHQFLQHAQIGITDDK